MAKNGLFVMDEFYVWWPPADYTGDVKINFIKKREPDLCTTIELINLKHDSDEDARELARWKDIFSHVVAKEKRDRDNWEAEEFGEDE